ncbi:MAG: 50S ribosomal protein L17, partial [Clostridia bacterium]|nr:50S ribosomal protein L17 [Clostridia bacterium]
KEYLKVVKEETTEKRQKDMPTRLNARRKMIRKLNKVKDSDGNNIDVPAMLFNEIAPKYAGKNVGGYTRIVKAGPRRGDAAEVAILSLI